MTSGHAQDGVAVPPEESGRVVDSASIPGDIFFDLFGGVSADNDAGRVEGSGDDGPAGDDRVVLNLYAFHNQAVCGNPDAITDDDVLRIVDALAGFGIEDGVGISCADIDVVGEHAPAADGQFGARFRDGKMHVFEGGFFSDAQCAVPILHPDFGAVVDAGSFSDGDPVVIAAQVEFDFFEDAPFTDFNRVVVAVDFEDDGGESRPVVPDRISFSPNCFQGRNGAFPARQRSDE